MWNSPIMGKVIQFVYPPVYYRERSDRRTPIQRLYACLCGSGLVSKSVCNATFPTKMAENMAATFAHFTQLLTYRITLPEA